MRFPKDQVVRVWSGERPGRSAVGTVVYPGTYEVGEQEVVYVRPTGSHCRAVAVSHIQVLREEPTP